MLKVPWTPLSTTPLPEGETDAVQGAHTGTKPHGLGTLFYSLSPLPSPPVLAQPSTMAPSLVLMPQEQWGSHFFWDLERFEGEVEVQIEK